MFRRRAYALDLTLSHPKHRLGAVIRAIRVEEGIRQAELAKVLGVSQSSLSKIESDRAEMTATQWWRFCAWAGITRLDLRFVKSRTPIVSVE